MGEVVPTAQYQDAFTTVRIDFALPQSTLRKENIVFSWITIVCYPCCLGCGGSDSLFHHALFHLWDTHMKPVRLGLYSWCTHRNVRQKTYFTWGRSDGCRPMSMLQTLWYKPTPPPPEWIWILWMNAFLSLLPRLPITKCCPRQSPLSGVQKISSTFANEPDSPDFQSLEVKHISLPWLDHYLMAACRIPSG